MAYRQRHVIYTASGPPPPPPPPVVLSSRSHVLFARVNFLMVSPLVAALDVDNGSVFLVALCSLRLTTGPRCSASWLVWTRRTVFHHLWCAHRRLLQWHVQWLVSQVVLLALYSFFLPSGQDARQLGRCGSEGQLLDALVVVTAVVCAWLVLLVTMLSRCILFDCRQARVAGHHGAPGQGCSLPVCATTRLMVQTVQMYVFVQFLNKVGDLPVAPVESPQVPFFNVVMVISTGAVVQTVKTVWKYAVAVHQRSSASLSLRGG